MKSGIHPRYEETTVTCACGNVFTTRSTRTNLRTDLCSVCHPFYTGEQRIVDSAGQVERFMKRMQVAASNESAQSKRQRRIAAKTAERGAQGRRDENDDLTTDVALQAAPADLAAVE